MGRDEEYLHPIPNQDLRSPLCSSLTIGTSSNVSLSPLLLVLTSLTVVSDLQRLCRNALLGFLPSPQPKLFYSFRPSSSNDLRQSHMVPISQISTARASHLLPVLPGVW